MLKFNTDVDECAEGTSGCSQECNNTIGSFECSCRDGYELDLDRKACNGMYVSVSLSTSNMCAHHKNTPPCLSMGTNQCVLSGLFMQSFLQILMNVKLPETWVGVSIFASTLWAATTVTAQQDSL